MSLSVSLKDKVINWSKRKTGSGAALETKSTAKTIERTAWNLQQKRGLWHL